MVYKNAYNYGSKLNTISLEPPDMPLAWCKRILLVSLVCQSNWSTNLRAVFAIPGFTEIDIKYTCQYPRKARFIFLEPPDMPLAWCKRILLISLVCQRYAETYLVYPIFTKIAITFFLFGIKHSHLKLKLLAYPPVSRFKSRAIDAPGTWYQQLDT